MREEERGIDEALALVGGLFLVKEYGVGIKAKG